MTTSTNTKTSTSPYTSLSLGNDLLAEASSLGSISDLVAQSILQQPEVAGEVILAGAARLRAHPKLFNTFVVQVSAALDRVQQHHCA